MSFLEERVNEQRSVEAKCYFLDTFAYDVLHGRESIKPLHSYLPSLMVQLFGFVDHSGGWMIDGEFNTKDADALTTLLRPDGNLFRLLLESGDSIYCDFPLDKLPTPVRQAIVNGNTSSLPPLFQRKVPRVAQSVNQSERMIRLCAFHYYLFCFAYFVASTRPSSHRVTNTKTTSKSPTTSLKSDLFSLMQMNGSKSSSSVSTASSGGSTPLALFDRIFVKYLDFVFGNMSAPRPLSESPNANLRAMASSNSNEGSSSDARWRYYEHYKRVNAKPNAPLRALLFDICMTFWTWQNPRSMSNVAAAHARYADERGTAGTQPLWHYPPPRPDLLRCAELTRFVLPTRMTLHALKEVTKYLVDETARVVSEAATVNVSSSSMSTSPHRTTPQHDDHGGVSLSDTMHDSLGGSNSSPATSSSSNSKQESSTAAMGNFTTPDGAVRINAVLQLGFAQIQTPLFHFLHQCMWYWSPGSSATDAKFTRMIDIWVTMLAPWQSEFYKRPPHVTKRAERLVQQQQQQQQQQHQQKQQDDEKSSSTIDLEESLVQADVEFWNEYVAGNLAMYTTLLGDLIVAAHDLDFTTSADRRLLAKPLRAIGDTGTVMNLVHSLESSLSDLNTRNNDRKSNDLTLRIAATHLRSLFAGTHTEYAPLFTAAFEHALLRLANTLAATTVRDRRRIVEKSLPWYKLLDNGFFGAPRETVRPPSNPPHELAVRLLKLFKLRESVLEMNVAGNGIDSPNQRRGGGSVHRRINVLASTRQTLTPRAPARHVAFRGDVWQRPVASYESRIAVRLLFAVATLTHRLTGWRPPLRRFASRSWVVTLFWFPLALLLFIFLLGERRA